MTLDPEDAGVIWRTLSSLQKDSRPGYVQWHVCERLLKTFDAVRFEGRPFWVQTVAKQLNDKPFRDEFLTRLIRYKLTS